MELLSNSVVACKLKAKHENFFFALPFGRISNQLLELTHARYGFLLVCYLVHFILPGSKKQIAIQNREVSEPSD